MDIYQTNWVVFEIFMIKTIDTLLIYYFLFSKKFGYKKDEFFARK